MIESRMFYFWRDPIDRLQQIICISWVSIIDGNFYDGKYEINLMASHDELLKEVNKALVECEMQYYAAKRKAREIPFGGIRSRVHREGMFYESIDRHPERTELFHTPWEILEYAKKRFGAA